ncbi:MAG: fructose-bisphosphate aldolase class I [Rhodospirillales bacterium]|nr:fructose-bisphosphate aldolase class I [Rhodospirillales bacterium]
MDENFLIDTAQKMVADHRGLLAIDESGGTIKKRFDTIGVVSTEENRRDYRSNLLGADDLGRYIGGVILFDETLRQSLADGTKIVDLIRAQGIVPGIKVDKGAKPLAGFAGETITEGLDGLAARVEEYVSLGAQFAKWRAVIHIGEGSPTSAAITANAHALARYARICQEGGLVPIVEPEVLMDGNHNIHTCQQVTEVTLDAVFTALKAQGVLLEGIILKPNMVIAGSDCPTQAGANEIADRTVATLCRCVPAAVPGITFLSGGQSEDEATLNLAVMNETFASPPWKLSFSYGRALQTSALKMWQGKPENEAASRDAFLQRARLNSQACAGEIPA